MVANCDRNSPLLRRMLIAVSALAIGFSLNAAAQTAAADHSSSGQNYSSSSVYQAYLSSDSLPGGSSLADPSASASASPQYGGGRQSSNYPSYESKWSHIAFEGGFGFSAPIGNDTTYSTADLNNGYLSPSEGFGYAITVGGGWNFTKKFGAMLEYQFLRQGMANDYLNALNAAEGTSSSGTPIGGNINTWSFTVDPVYYLPINHKSGVYVTGGGGFYRKVSNFTEPVESCYYYCVDYAETVDHFSSNQGGFNGGLGFYHKVFGEDSNGKLFAEVRYVWVNSPGPSSSNSYQGSGTEALIPVTFGVRF
ncbi:MAG TPA: hypothetical protein VL990_05880 [Acidobacteriaceae bacterium]|nr:hypothetical protein [Acidobacteriaceae bacterium]